MRLRCRLRDILRKFPVTQQSGFQNPPGLSNLYDGGTDENVARADVPMEDAGFLPCLLVAWIDMSGYWAYGTDACTGHRPWKAS